MEAAAGPLFMLLPAAMAAAAAASDGERISYPGDCGCEAEDVLEEEDVAVQGGAPAAGRFLRSRDICRRSANFEDG